MKDTLMKQLTNPLFLFCFIPGFYLLFGTVFAMQYTEIQLMPFAMLYLYIMLNQILEHAFKPRSDEQNRIPFFSILLIEICLLALSIYFGWAYSLFTALLMICYSVMIQSQYLFRYYDLSLLSLCLLALFKAVLINGLSFYTHTGFIPLQLLVWTIPLVLPIIFMEWDRWKLKISDSLTKILLTATYVIGVSALFSIVGLYTVLLIITLPFAYRTWKNQTNRNIPLFTLSFLFAHFLIALLFFITLF